jgi:hypothetical protein
VKVLFYKLVFVLSFSGVWCQGGFISESKFEGAHDHTAWDISEVSSGSYIAIGLADVSNSIGNFSKLVISGLDDKGSVKWQKNYGSNYYSFGNNTFAYRICRRFDSHLYFTLGLINTVTGTPQRAVLLKINLSGDTVWQRLFDSWTTSEGLFPQSLCQAVDGGILIAGSYNTQTGKPGLLIKTDRNGKELWRKKINKAAPNVIDCKTILQDPITKDILMGGYHYIGGTTEGSSILVLDSLGTMKGIYQHFLGQIRDMIITSDGNVVAVGGKSDLSSYAFKFSVGNPTVQIWKLDNYDGPNQVGNSFNAVAELPNHELLISGEYFDNSSGKPMGKARIVRTTADGVVKSRRVFDYKTPADSLWNFQKPNSIGLTSDGGYAVAIRTENFYNNPFLFVKYDSTGCDNTEAICKSVGLNSVGIANSLVAFPNPVIDILAIKCLLSDLRNYLIMDQLGRELVKGELNSEDQNIDVSFLQEGAYYLTIDTEFHKIVFKFIKAKQ